MGGSEGGWEEEGERGGKERKGGREEGRLRSSRPRLIEERDTVPVLVSELVLCWLQLG